MKWTAKQVDQLILEMASQAKAASWGDRHAVDRAHILRQIMKHYGWVRRDQHPPEVCDAAVAIAFHAPGMNGPLLRLQVLGCLFADSHHAAALYHEEQSQPRRRFFRLPRIRKATDARIKGPPAARITREHFARMLDETLADFKAATVFGTTRPRFKDGKLHYAELCCPNDLLWLRCSLGTSEPDSTVQPL
ncbi:MAG: hypothetical protein ACE37H_12030 [Phycisphaeraceae bacterium]